ncbi:DoxX family protein [Saccharopolyspora flava]|uniref:Putative oxidoreductase n=1 Tax=Saccharopolyspora flava TaxID=95161 RepID=A0A1I6V1T6_9PSEU|nr:DoxX family protein [Saccharopolyspora flava]SFT07681.1 putative oxidoreductase [Saccharopolyspora flava]
MSSLDGKTESYAPYALGVFRIVVGALFASHGAASLFGVFGGAPGSGGTVPFGVWPSWWAAVIQLVCGLLVAFGVLHRGAAVLASGSMAYAYFIVHQPDGLLPLQNDGEQAALFAWSFLLLAFTGPGALALVRTRRRQPEPAAA